ncbi:MULTISPECIES: hypothetical protein [unclassified Sphingomonas]|uniref:hypothetical protein n=1 Tax=unclassified Sphingomonas TaxID=196159 RepID=UPI000E10D57B|nr:MULTISPECIES: hypothetical protein [unclassified Sphingomonas]AXJ96122.1 hypothetical protein DM480_12045 [Sphingomonas sp. FARSPH]
MIAFQVYLLSLTATLYLLRGMLELPDGGWRFEVALTAGVGVGVLPVLAALAAVDVTWGRWLVVALSALGAIVNAVLLVRLWQGFSMVAYITMLIIVLYAAVVALVVL